MTVAGSKAAVTLPRWLLPTLIVYTIAGGLLLGPAALMAMMSPMLSDSGINFYVGAAILGVSLAPMVLLASLVAAWVCYSMGRYRISVIAMCVPIVWLAFIALCFIGLDAFPPKP
jgi:hypothetical protein